MKVNFPRWTDGGAVSAESDVLKGVQDPVQRLGLTLLYSGYEKQPLAMGLSMLISLLGGLAAQDRFGQYPEIMLWFIAVQISIVTGIVGYFVFIRCRPDANQLRRWQYVFFAQCVVTGLAWTSGPCLVLIHERPIAVVYFSIALLAVCACAISLLSATLPGLLAFLATAMLPFIIALQWVSGESDALLVGEMLVAFGALVACAIDYHRSSRRRFLMQFAAEQSAIESKAARELAESANETKSRFLATMSHELRTPMSSILGLLDLLQVTPLSAKQGDYVTKTKGAAQSLLSLLNDILDYSKIEAGKFAIDPHPFSMKRLLQDLSLLQAAGLGGKPIEVRFEVAPDIPPVLVGDAMRLRQVLMNLIGNAIKFTERGEVVVRMRLLAQVGASVDIHFSVQDTGIGISSDQQTRIFDEFSQAHTSTTRRYGGTGLGLTICMKLVAMMGGTLQVTSTPGEGSTFWFVLRLQPLNLTNEAVQEPSLSQSSSSHWLTSNAEQRLTGLRILLADDNLLNQHVASEMLKLEGAIVTLASNGQQVVDVLENAAGAIDLVLLDWHMPVMDGLVTAQYIRSSLNITALPLVAMTANAMASDREACIQAGMQDHIGKPFNRETLVAVVRKHARIG